MTTKIRRETPTWVSIISTASSTVKKILSGRKACAISYYKFLKQQKQICTVKHQKQL